jgi:leader peptidase (prepilin peptidase)/N-methyltransferase
MVFLPLRRRGQPMILFLVLCGFLASILINGLADNLPASEDRPFPSPFLPRCEYCGSTRKARDLSAVFSSIFQEARCLRCGAPRPFRDLSVEAALMLLFPSLWLFGITGAREIFWAGYVVSIFLLFLVVDFEHRYVLGEVVGLSALILILGGGLQGFPALLRILEGGLAGFLIFLFLFFLGKALGWIFRLGQGIEPLGFGDVILAGLVGIATGWPSVLLAILLSIIIAGFAGLILLIVSLVKGESAGTATMAYGPYLLVSGLIVYFYAGPFLNWILTRLAAV